MIDSELFELCKEVYEKTGWSHTGKVYAKDWKGEVDSFTIDSGILKNTPAICPLYTSDYLLERLPPCVDTVWFLTVGEAFGAWGAWYMHGVSQQTHGQLQVIGKIPIKALLKLAIALDDAGVKL